METIVAVYYMVELANKIQHELNHLYLISGEQLTLARHPAIFDRIWESVEGVFDRLILVNAVNTVLNRAWVVERTPDESCGSDLDLALKTVPVLTRRSVVNVAYENEVFETLSVQMTT